jgi:hypothetical protein
MTAQVIDFYNAKMQMWARKLYDARQDEERRHAIQKTALKEYAETIAEVASQPTRLMWQRIASRHWQLVEVDNPESVWARVEPYGNGQRRGRGMFAQPTAKALCLHPDMPSRHGEQHWSMASTVASAKRDIVEYISRHSNAPDFEVVAPNLAS